MCGYATVRVSDCWRLPGYPSGSARGCWTMLRWRYAWAVAFSVDVALAFEPSDEDGWIMARVMGVPGAISQGRSRQEARENALDALRTVLTPDEELAGQAPEADREHVRLTAAG